MLRTLAMTADAHNTYFIRTFGCQMNEHDSGRMAHLLEAAGYTPAPAMDQADIVIAHNGDNFDIKAGNTRFQEHGLGAPSPYQSVDPDATYPRVFFYTSTKDDRVHPGHARKMMARMKDQGHGSLYYENTEGGHGRGVNMAQHARHFAMQYTYLWRQLGRN